MKQYLELLKEINETGDHKSDAREGLPGTKSLFGPQMEFNLSEGFPIITTKKVSFNNIVVELLWFLKGETNIKYLVDHGVNIWNEDAYNYFCKLFPDIAPHKTLEQFIEDVKLGVTLEGRYTFGDTGNQYPKTWRNFGANDTNFLSEIKGIDQITRVLGSLKNNPNGRRHLVSSIDVQGDQDLALYWCHALFQFNCRKTTTNYRMLWAKNKEYSHLDVDNQEIPKITQWLDHIGAPEYFLDCKLYQRSADTILGVPYNISSYSLLMEIFAKILNYAPGRFIHSFGDVHIYDNHQEAVDLQLTRNPLPLPKLVFNTQFEFLVLDYREGTLTLNEVIEKLRPHMFSLENYQHHAPIKATLNTGMKKIEMRNGSSLEWKDDDLGEGGRSLDQANRDE